MVGSRDPGAIPVTSCAGRGRSAGVRQRGLPVNWSTSAAGLAKYTAPRARLRQIPSEWQRYGTGVSTTSSMQTTVGGSPPVISKAMPAWGSFAVKVNMKLVRLSDGGVSVVSKSVV